MSRKLVGSMIEERVAIEWAEGEKVSGMLAFPGKAPGKSLTGVVIAHGAGGNMEHDFIADMARSIAKAGYATLRFNFPYAEKGRKAPDKPAKLGAAWQAAARFMRDRFPAPIDRLIVGGKSMGGRIASQLVAAGELEADGLMLLGYPLHPAGKPEKLRDGHLYDIRIPILFVEGTRDSLCRFDLLEGVMGRLQAPWEMEVIEGGDHSFRVLKSMGTSKEEVRRNILARTLDWLSSLPGEP